MGQTGYSVLQVGGGDSQTHSENTAKKRAGASRGLTRRGWAGLNSLWL